MSNVRPRGFTTTGLIPGNRALLDWVRGPWSSTSAFFDNVDEIFRVLGMEFLVTTDGYNFELYRLQGNVNNAVLVTTSAIENISFWINPAVSEYVTILPEDPDDGYRVMLNDGGTGVFSIQQYDEDTTSWEILYDNGTSGIELQEGMAVIVNLAEILGISYKNQLYVFESGEFVRKVDGVAPNNNLFYTQHDGFVRRVWDAREEIDIRAIQNSGVYKVLSSIDNIPAEFTALDPVELLFLEVNYADEDNLLYKLSSTNNSYIQTKINGGDFSSWIEWKGEQGPQGEFADVDASLIPDSPNPVESQVIQEALDAQKSQGDANNLNVSDGTGGFSESMLEVENAHLSPKLKHKLDTSDSGIEMFDDGSTHIKAVTEILLQSDNPFVLKLDFTPFTPTSDNHITNKKYVDDKVLEVDESKWETDGATNIKPKNSKLVDAGNITGVLTGGLFHP